MGFPDEGVPKAYKHNEKKSTSHMLIFLCTNLNRKSPIHYWIEKAKQERHFNTKINVTNRS